MKAVFNLIAWISALIGIMVLFVALFWLWSIALFVSGAIALLHSYAWGLVSDMWERLERAERKLSGIGRLW